MWAICVNTIFGSNFRIWGHKLVRNVERIRTICYLDIGRISLSVCIRSYYAKNSYLCRAHVYRNIYTGKKTPTNFPWPSRMNALELFDCFFYASNNHANLFPFLFSITDIRKWPAHLCSERRLFENRLVRNAMDRTTVPLSKKHDTNTRQAYTCHYQSSEERKTGSDSGAWQSWCVPYILGRTKIGWNGEYRWWR